MAASRNSHLRRLDIAGRDGIGRSFFYGCGVLIRLFLSVFFLSLL